MKVPNTLKIQSNKRDIDIDFGNIKLTHRKDQILHNCVEPEIGLQIFNMAFKDKQKDLR